MGTLVQARVHQASLPAGRRRRGRKHLRPVCERVGHAGDLVVKEILSRGNLGIKPIGFLDDDPTRRGMVIHGIPVLGSPGDLEYVSNAYGAKQALITLDNRTGSVIRSSEDSS